MYIEKLKYFIDLYECRSFTETAKRNFISQASISQYITNLEKDLEVKLFDRSTTPITTTDAGTLFYNQSKMLLNQYQVIRRQVKEIQEDQVTHIKIAYVYIYDLKLLLPLVDLFEKNKVNIKIDLVKVHFTDIETVVATGECDFALSYSDRFTKKTIKSIGLKKGEYHALVPKGHPLYDRDHLTMEEIVKHPLLMMGEETGSRNFLDLNHFAREGNVPKVTRMVNYFEEGLFYIITDKLIGFSSEDDKLENLYGLIKNIPITDQRYDYQFVLAYHKDNPKEVIHSISSLIEQYKDHLAL